jgi:hypothetical protein
MEWTSVNLPLVGFYVGVDHKAVTIKPIPAISNRKAATRDMAKGDNFSG